MSVSVVIPAYKASASIARAIRSAITQSVPPCEILVIDDASPDFADLEAAMADVAIPEMITLRILRNATNMNGAAARNRGINEARGDYIAFLDADDEWEPEKLEACLAALVGQGGRTMAYSKARIVTSNANDGERPMRGIGPAEHMSEYLFLSGGFMQTSTIVCPRGVATEVQFNPAFRRHQDYDFCLRAAAAGVRTVFVDRVLVTYHSASGVFAERLEDF